MVFNLDQDQVQDQDQYRTFERQPSIKLIALQQFGRVVPSCGAAPNDQITSQNELKTKNSLARLSTQSTLI